MRLLTSLLPAGLITLVLFALMCYLITTSHGPLKPPVDTGFVDLIRIQKENHESEPPRIARSLTTPPARLEESPSLPQPVVAGATAPRLPPLSMPMSALPPPVLDGGPYLDAFAPPTLTERAKSTSPAAEAKPAEKSVPPSKVVSADTATSGGAELSGVPQLPAGIGEVGSLSRDAIPLLKVEPAYPRKAARARKEGWVKVEFTITEQGQVLDPVVVKSRPRKLFNSSALAAIRKWRFEPKLIDGKPVMARATQVIEFKLAER